MLCGPRFAASISVCRMTSAVIAPDECAICEHLSGGRFLAGVAAGRWRLISVSWPFALMSVSAAERPESPSEFVLRFELTGYPHSAPTGGLWDIATDSSLTPNQRPKGERAAQLFRIDGWVGGATAMYAPWDRVGLQAHAEWAQSYRLQAWNPTRDLSFVLANVHEVLNADDYLGI
jgi:hypothetical protein